MLDKMMNLIMGVVVIAIMLVVSMTVLSSMNSTVKEYTATSNVTSVMVEQLETISTFMPIIMVVAILGITLTVISRFMYGSYEEEYEEETKNMEVKPHKQTYFEYVKERLAIEKLMRRK